MPTKPEPRESITPSARPQQVPESFRLLVERVKDYAIFLLDLDGKVASWNEGLQRIKGYTAQEIIGKHMSAFYTQEDLDAKLPQHLLEVAKSDGRVENEGWRLRKDGSKFWADVVITALRDDSGKLIGFGKVTRDLTERKKAEDALAELAGRLVQIQDEERRRIGRELHDTTSPLLTSLTGKLYSARQRARTINSDLGNTVDEALALAEATATMVRTVSSLLHPQLLEQSGLLPTLRWYLDTFASRTGVKVDFKIPESMQRLSREREVALFRVTQEWLSSALSVGAKVVRFRLTPASDEVEMTIEASDGDWLPEIVDQLRTCTGQLGITYAGIRERLRQLGGHLDIRPRDAGVILRVRVPTGDDRKKR